MIGRLRQVTRIITVQIVPEGTDTPETIAARGVASDNSILEFHRAVGVVENTTTIFCNAIVADGDVRQDQCARNNCITICGWIGVNADDNLGNIRNTTAITINALRGIAADGNVGECRAAAPVANSAPEAYWAGGRVATYRAVYDL